MSIYSRFLVAVGDRRWFVAAASRIAPRLDRMVYGITRGRRLATPPSVPTFFLTTTGRRTQEPRTVALSYVEEGGDYIVVDTSWGRSSTPDWSLNLAANPQAMIEMAGEQILVEARAVTSTEALALWATFCAMWPPYAEYRRRITGRIVRMIRLVER